ncbi:polyisoprenyl-teichoic acid--peptidoglycan teichoic acid transferase TagU [Robertmurraya kyonggiensis]|uniref:Polyisoprenyl-teichoic acid--peptidoglycan teichoic acid transferase TagU n=1 Tax=Robertmurraya kyonggiensis TaxID=1037680 RepID=A0A4U1D465_9BACI|nr:LytR family transcriptional regulator [Robertmurraya kyonggiensis]TKC16994.1 LytR family transcriptional regulator [Robertmurraya kyonggiensis]
MISRLDKKQKRKKKKWVKVLLIVILLLFIAVGTYAFTVYRSLTNAVDTMHAPIDREKSEKRTEQVDLEKAQPFSVLLLGVDEREGDRGRSDTMIVLAVNPSKNSVKMLSIPRDSRTEIIGKGTTDKINHAYAFGGVEMSIATVENFLDLPIDHYVQINMEGFQDIVNAVGGVTVQNDLDFTYEGTHFPEGELSLDGTKALKYSRMRYEDPRGDFGRQQRQRQIIKAIIDEGASLNTLTNFGDIFTALGQNVKTDLSFDQMVTIQSKYRTAAKEIEQVTVNGQGTKIDGIYYLQVSNEEKSRLTSILEEHLELDE